MIKNTITIILLFVGLQLFSQENYEMTFGYYDPVIADTSEFYSHLTVDCYVVNTGEDTIFSQIRAMIVVNPDSGEYVARQMLSISFENGIGLNPGDSVHFPAPNLNQDGAYDVVLPSNNYVDGDNIIVVWPVLDGNYSFISEQYSKGVFVNDPTSIEDKFISDVKVLVSNSFVEVVSDFDIDQLQLFNLEGKLMVESKSNKLLIDDLSTGIYLVHLIQKGTLISRTVFLN
jgi:hypothetical protein